MDGSGIGDVSSNATPIEIAYTAVMFIGLLITLVNAVWAHQRVRELKRQHQDGILLVTRKGARSDQIAIALAFLGMTCIGVISCTTPPNPNVTQAGVLSGVAFIAVGVALMWESVSVRLRPAAQRHALTEDQQGKVGGS